MSRLLRSPVDFTAADIRTLYDNFNSPIAKLDCGKKCASHNPNGKPFCCDICQAVPAVYKSEWNYFQGTTNLWHRYTGRECKGSDDTGHTLRDSELPAGMLFLACLGPDQCQREYRALCCRAFPFFPYITSDYRFLGLACEWEMETTCWVISNLGAVTEKYCTEFLHTFYSLLALFDDILENYAFHSGRLRAYAISRKKRFPLLHRNGNAYLVSPASERMQRVEFSRLPVYKAYRNE